MEIHVIYTPSLLLQDTAVGRLHRGATAMAGHHTGREKTEYPVPSFQAQAVLDVSNVITVQTSSARLGQYRGNRPSLPSSNADPG